MNVLHLVAAIGHIVAIIFRLSSRDDAALLLDMKDEQIDYWYNKAREEMRARVAAENIMRLSKLAVLVMLALFAFLAFAMLSPNL